MLADVMLPLKLTFRLWLRFWPQLFAVLLLGVIASHVLMQLAVDAAYINHYMGLAVLTLVALAQLVTTVSMIQIVRPGLPALNAAQEKIQTGSDSGDTRHGSFGLDRLILLLAAVSQDLHQFADFFQGERHLGEDDVLDAHPAHVVFPTLAE